MSELKDVKRGVPGSGCGGGEQAKLPLLTPSFRCLFRGPPSLSLGPWPSPLPPKSCTLCGLVPGLPGGGARGS